MRRQALGYVQTPAVGPAAAKRASSSRRRGDHGPPAPKSSREHDQETGIAAALAMPRPCRRRRVQTLRPPRAALQAPARSALTAPITSPLAPPSTLQELLVDTPLHPVFLPGSLPAPAPERSVSPVRRQRRQTTKEGSQSSEKNVPGKCALYSYNIRMKELAKRKDLKGCFDLCADIRAEGLSPDKFTYSSMLACCARVDAVDTALDLYDLMKSERVPIDDYIRTNLLTVAANTTPPRIDICQRVFRTCRKPSKVMCNVLIDAYARCGRVEDCLRTYRYMALRSMKADRYTTSALVKAFVKADRLDEAVGKIHEMRAAGLEVCSVAFGQVMDAYGRKGSMDKAVAMFDSMTLYGIQPTQVTYNILIGACAGVLQTERAFEIFEEMKATSSFRGDRYTYHCLMKCCLSTGEGRRALDMYRCIRAANFPCNQVSYRMALTAAGQVLDGDAVSEVARDMIAHKSTPRDDTAATLVAAAIRCSDLESAVQYFGDYLERQTIGAKVDCFFDAIRNALKSFEEHRVSNTPDFEYTALVVDELDRNWRRGL